jgi:hypothetical protein
MAPGQSHRAGASSGGSVQVNVAACSGGAARRAKRRGACEAPRASSRQCCAAHRGSIPDALWHPSEKPVTSMTWRANWRPFGLTICTRRRFRADRPVCAHGSETEARDHVRRTKYPRTATLAARVGKRQWSIFCRREPAAPTAAYLRLCSGPPGPGPRCPERTKGAAPPAAPFPVFPALILRRNRPGSTRISPSSRSASGAAGTALP